MSHPYQFHMIVRFEEMTHAERLAADERSARIAREVFGLGAGVRRGVRGLLRSLARAGRRPAAATMGVRESL